MPDHISQLLKSDCSACTGLCCKFFAFEAGDEFAIDKPAGVRCPKLSTDNRCSIHSKLAKSGFSGCVTFDCNGAGPWFLRAMENTTPVADYSEIEAFRSARNIRTALAHLHTAGSLDLSATQRRDRRRLMAALTPDINDSLSLILGFEHGSLPACIDAFIKSLRPLAR